MAFVFYSTAFLAAAAAPPWPLARVETLLAEGELTTSLGVTETVQEWYQFSSGPPHCDLRHRIDYPTTKVITTVEPNSDTYTTVTFSNSSTGPQCNVHSAPFNESQCINQFAALGSIFNFTSTQPCPAPHSSSSCDVWTSKTVQSEQLYYFLSGTAVAVQYSITITITSTIKFSNWLVDLPIPDSTWQTPSSWMPCMPAKDDSLMKGTSWMPFMPLQEHLRKRI